MAGSYVTWYYDIRPVAGVKSCEMMSRHLLLSESSKCQQVVMWDDESGDVTV